MGLLYTGQVRLNWKSPRLAMLASLALLGLAGAGCSGINANGSVSPATFFLPGLMKADPPRSSEAPVYAAVSSPEIACAR
jgi:hypothetical protein